MALTNERCWASGCTTDASRTTTTGAENSDQLGTSQQISRNEASSGPLKLPKLLSVLPTSSVQSNSSPNGCRNNQKQEEAFHIFSLALTVSTVITLVLDFDLDIRTT